MISNRLRKRLLATGLDCYDKYLQHVKTLKAADPEWNAFLDAITTHETYLFRDQNQWDWFSDTYLPMIQSEADAGRRSRRLRIWSAACSTGDEPFTFACCLAARIRQPEKWSVEIVGTDIGLSTLEQAKSGRFNERSMQKVPDNWQRRFFEQVDNDWLAKPVLSDMIRFKQHNLIEPFSGFSFDLICIKNVLIYFDQKSKIPVMANLFQQLAKGGYLMIGPAEGVSTLVDEYEKVLPWLYRKPDPSNMANQGA